MEPSGLELPTPACHAGALPTELWPHLIIIYPNEKIFLINKKNNI